MTLNQQINKAIMEGDFDWADTLHAIRDDEVVINFIVNRTLGNEKRMARLRDWPFPSRLKVKVRDFAIADGDLFKRMWGRSMPPHADIINEAVDRIIAAI